MIGKGREWMGWGFGVWRGSWNGDEWAGGMCVGLVGGVVCGV